MNIIKTDYYMCLIKISSQIYGTINMSKEGSAKLRECLLERMKNKSNINK